MKRNVPIVHSPRATRAMRGTSMSISQLARRAQEPAHVIRYYCRIGLLEPTLRGSNGYRQFGERALDCIHFIRRAQALGFTLDEIAGIFHCARGGRSPCPEVRNIIAQRIPYVAAQLKAMTALHKRMTRALSRWRRLPNQIPTGDVVCALIQSEMAHSKTASTN